MHPFCRSTTAPVIDEDFLTSRRAKNPKTGEYDEIPPEMNYKQWKEKYVEGKEPVEEVKQEQVKAESSKETERGYKLEVPAKEINTSEGETVYKETAVSPKQQEEKEFNSEAYDNHVKEEAEKQVEKTLNYEENYKKANEALNNIGDEVPEEYRKKIESNISVSKTDFDKQYKEVEELQKNNKIATLYSLPNNLETKSNQESEQEYFRGIDSSKDINTQKDTTIALNLTLSNKTIITPLQAGLIRVAIENYTKDKEDNFYSSIRFAQNALIKNNQDKESKAYISYFKNFIKSIEDFIKISPKYKGTIYRGMALEPLFSTDYLEINNAYNMRGMSSWSTSLEQAKEYARKNKNEEKSNCLIFTMEDCKTGTSVRHLSKAPVDEKEVLVSGYTDFITTRIEQKEDFTYIYVKEI